MRTSAIYEPRPCNLTPLLATALSFPPSLRCVSSVKVHVQSGGRARAAQRVQYFRKIGIPGGESFKTKSFTATDQH